MSRTDTPRSLRSRHALGFAVLAAALLFAAAFSAAAVGDGDSDGAVTEVVKHKVKVGITNGLGVSDVYVADGENATFTIRPTSDFAVPSAEEVKKTDFTGTFKDIVYTPGEDRLSATLVFHEVKGDVNGTVKCVPKVAVDMTYGHEGADDVTEAVGKFVPGGKVSGQFPEIPGYSFPLTVKVVQGETEYPELAKGYDPDTGKFEFKLTDKIKGDRKLTVIGHCPNAEYELDGNVFNGTIGNPADDKPVFNKPFTITIVPDPHHDFPDPRDLTVTNGTSKEFSYDSTTGTVTIDRVIGDVKVVSKCNPKAYTVTYCYLDSGEKVAMDLQPGRYLYGVGCQLPVTADREGYVFQYWYDSEGNRITQIDPGFVPADDSNIDVYAYFLDDLSGYNPVHYQIPYIVVAVLALIGVIAVPFVTRVVK